MNDARSRVANRSWSTKSWSGSGKQSVKQKRQAGFTIVETMIVLAVMGVMLISAVLLVAGQQSKVEFSQAIRDIQSNIQATINEVGAGYYQNADQLKCTVVGTSLNLTTGSTAQGSNTGCIFLGKVLQFGVGGTDPQQYIVHSIAGLQDNNGSLSSANPKDIAPGQNTNNSANFPDVSEVKNLNNGLTAVSMTYNDGTTDKSIGAVGFISELGQYSGGLLMSGTQNIDLVPVDNSGTGPTLSTSKPLVVDAINNNLKSSPINPKGGVSICFASGGTNQSGLIRIGSNGRTLSVTMDIKGSKDCS